MKMNRVYCMAAAVILAACSPAPHEEAADLRAAPATDAPAPANIPMKVPKDGRITLTTETVLSEPDACVIPIRVNNGTEAEVNVSMFGFSVTGPGNDDTGNMFARPVQPGEALASRIIMIGQDCAAFDTISTTEILCESAGSDCAALVDFEDGPQIALIKR